MVANANVAVNGRSHALANAPQGAPLVPTILGGATPRIPVGGRIRAGIKVLTKAASEISQAREIYERGVEEGRGFESIERDLGKAMPNLKNPLMPKNVPHFTVRGEDFPNPEIAKQIMEKFAEDRGDGVRRLYRFPVVFPADAWQNVMPHEMVTWTSSERKFWSEYSADGSTRYCKTHEVVPVDGNGKRTIRIWGGRKTITRVENGGLCDPETCREYQDKKCNLSGRFIFFIPGIRSISAFELPTNSFYAMQAAIEKFQTISFMRGGRISGFLDGQTPFYITKRLVEVSRIDDEGKAKRVSQWLIELEAPIDLTALLRPDDGLEALEARASEAVAVLEGPTATVVQVADADGVIESAARFESGAACASGPQQPKQEAKGSQTASGGGGGARGTHNAAAPVTQAPAAQGGDAQPKGASGDELGWIFDAARALGVPQERFEAYAEKKWGKGWKLAAGGRKRALDDLAAFEENSEGFLKKVAGELDFFN